MSVYVFETTFPNLSATTKWVVSSPPAESGSPGLTAALGVALSVSISGRRRAAYFFEAISPAGTGEKSGSPRCLDLSA